MDSILPELRAVTSTSIDVNLEQSIRTLGMMWNPQKDKFTFATKHVNEKYTKRNNLSDISKLFDPFGLVGPIIVTAKSLMQLIWKADIV